MPDDLERVSEAAKTEKLDAGEGLVVSLYNDYGKFSKLDATKSTNDVNLPLGNLTIVDDTTRETGAAKTADTGTSKGHAHREAIIDALKNAIQGRTTEGNPDPRATTSERFQSPVDTVRKSARNENSADAPVAKRAEPQSDTQRSLPPGETAARDERSKEAPVGRGAEARPDTQRSSSPNESASESIRGERSNDVPVARQGESKSDTQRSSSAVETPGRRVERFDAPAESGHDSGRASGSESSRESRSEDKEVSVEDARKSFDTAGELFNSSRRLSPGERSQAHQQLAESIRQIKKLEGESGVTAAVQRLNSQLGENGSIYSVDAERPRNQAESKYLSLKESDRIVSVKQIGDATPDNTVSQQGVRSTASDTAAAVRSGNAESIAQSLRGAFDTVKGNPQQFSKFNRELAAQLQRDGIIVKFDKSGRTGVSLHKEGSPFGVEFTVRENEQTGKPEVSAQTYDWATKRDVERPSTDVLKEMTSEKSEQPAPQKSIAEVARDASSAIKAGDMSSIQKSLKDAFEAVNGDAREFAKFNARLAEQLKKDGITLKFDKDQGTQVSIHRDGSAHAVDFTLSPNSATGRPDIKAQAYDWQTKRDVDNVSAGDIVRDFANRESQQPAAQLEKTPERAVADASAAIRSGNMDSIQNALKDAFEAVKGNPREFAKFNQQLANQLQKDGFDLKFDRRGGTQVSIHRNGSPNAVDFSVQNNPRTGRPEVKAQAYDWDTKSNVKHVSPADVVADMRPREATKDRGDDTKEAPERSDAREKSAERADLEKSAREALSPDQFRQFKENLNKFEKTAAENKLSSEEVAKTFKATRELLDAPNTHFSRSERAQLAFQHMKQAADPSVIDQGQNNTCNATCVEKVMYAQQPSKVIEMTRDIAQTGKMKAADGTEIDFKPGQLRPDGEASRLNTKDGDRSYATQITNLALLNAYWQTQTKFEGRDVPKGSIRYEKLGDGAERLMDYSKNPPAPLKDKSGEVIDSPNITVGRMPEVMKAVTGTMPDDMILFRSTDFSSKGVRGVGSQESLEEKLSELNQGKEGKRFPIVATLFNVGELTGVRGEDGGHVVTITGVERGPDGKMMVKIDNQYGKGQDVTIPVENLWRSMATRNKRDK